MKFPLPIDTGIVLEKNLSKVTNLGLLFNKYVNSWPADWQMKEEDSKKFREFIADIKFNRECILSVLNRRQAMNKCLKNSGWYVESFIAATDSRLIIGLGGTSVIETGMTLHPLYGFPYLPGSGLKGLARAFAEIGFGAQKEELFEVFGSEDKDPRHAANNRQGKVFFMDALPTSFPKLELDIMNPHYSDYYKGDKPPADYLSPIPITFLAVAAKQEFYFNVYSKDKELAEKARQWLEGGLVELGAGGKTNVGYGYFKISSPIGSPTVSVITNSQEATNQVEKIDLIKAKLKSIKNPKMFDEFIKEIKSEDIPHLTALSFKGMESVINIGLVPVLENAGIPKDVKRIVAQKMLEVCKEPDKKYVEKQGKYKKLKLLAEEKL
jgi:CRISPR-associated protein Cmr6